MSRHHKRTPAREWEGIRERTFAEQGRRCGTCGKAGALEVHHVKELRHGGTNDPGNLQVLCRDCHIGAHRPAPGSEVLAWQLLLGRS